LQGLAWVLLVFFVFALLAYVFVRISETKKATPPPLSQEAKGSGASLRPATSENG
jgi:hypothetical protein